MKKQTHFLDDCALSPVVGEMMMIVLAILLVSLFSVTLLGLLPSERSDTVDISMNNTSTAVTLWHKGGDWIKKSDLQVIIISGKETTPIKSSNDVFQLQGNSFDLGDTITVDTPLKGGDIVRLVSRRNIVYSGVIKGAK